MPDHTTCLPRFQGSLQDRSSLSIEGVDDIIIIPYYLLQLSSPKVGQQSRPKGKIHSAQQKEIRITDTTGRTKEEERKVLKEGSFEASS